MHGSPEGEHTSPLEPVGLPRRNQPAIITRPSTSGSTNIPMATGLGECTTKYSPINATIHESTINDSNGVVTNTIGFLKARLAKNAV